MTTLMPILRPSRFFGMPERRLLDHFFEDFDLPAFSGKEGGWMPNIDVSENDKEIVVRAELPGMDKKDIDISLTDGILTIKGEKKTETKEENEHYHLTERRYGSFCRTLKMPEEVVIKKVDATYKDGILRVTCPKAEKAAPKKITVN